MELFGIRKAFNRRNFIGRGGYLEICRIAYPLIFMTASNSIDRNTKCFFISMLLSVRGFPLSCW